MWNADLSAGGAGSQSIDDAARAVEARGVPCEASLETPMACGYGVCLGCPVPRRREGSRHTGYLYACTEGPCVDAAQIDWHPGASS